MLRRIPPLNALKSFEAAARHLSFTKAADELFVTQAAISHQIKTLEEFLGMPLFRRLNRSLMLTDEGQILFPAMSEALDLIMVTTDRLHRHQQVGMLNIATMDSLAANWLVPRLGRFRRAYPDIDVRVSTSDELIDYARVGIDLGIRYGRGDWPGVHVTHLMTEEIFPVCSPKILGGEHKLNTPDDLQNFTLLHDDMREDWRMWLMAVGATKVDPLRGPGFMHSNLVYQAAVFGEGVALGRSVLVADELEQGRLVKVLDFSLPANYAYWIVSPIAAAEHPKVKLLRDWLLAEAADQ